MKLKYFVCKLNGINRYGAHILFRYYTHILVCRHSFEWDMLLCLHLIIINHTLVLYVYLYMWWIAEINYWLRKRVCFFVFFFLFVSYIDESLDNLPIAILCMHTVYFSYSFVRTSCVHFLFFVWPVNWLVYTKYQWRQLFMCVKTKSDIVTDW